MTWHPVNWPWPRRPTSEDDPRCEDYTDAERDRWAPEITARDERTLYWHEPPS